jgi:hypothetical protein
MDPEKVAAIIDRKPPTTLKLVQSWLGLPNYYRRFIRDYAKIDAPLYKQISAGPKRPRNQTRIRLSIRL